jgi:Flp pilus assembly protein TadD
MFECSICGLLSLNAISCPACGSQNLIDLSVSDSHNEDLPTEIPGLDDAAESWHELEGSTDENSGSSTQTQLSNKPNSDGNLPFGFSGESNVKVSRLPFGIGSHADGIPFDSQTTVRNDANIISDEEPLNEISNLPVSTDHKTSLDETEFDEPEEYNMAMAEVVIQRPAMPRIQPLIEPNVADIASLDVDLPTEFEAQGSSSLDEIPNEWRISASAANMEEIYANKNEDVEVVHHYEEDVVVFDHEQTNHVQSLPSVIIEDHDVLSLELHPARALDVDLSNNPECRDDLDSGYFAIAKNSWAEAAIKFQKIASRMPGDSSVYNNYGLALLQRAIEMAKDGDESIQIMASSQFESAILALREAAKSAPGESTILLNLAHALLVSGRSEKAMKIIQVHNSKHPNSVEGANLEAAALVSLGQSVNAKAKLTKFKGDSIVDENLARLL